MEAVKVGRFFPIDSTQAIGWEDLTDKWWIAYRFGEGNHEMHCSTKGMFDSQEEAMTECIKLNMMTQTVYLKHGGLLCPVCLSKNVIADESFESDTVEGWRGIYCQDCKTIWQDLYKLYGYEIVSIGKPNDTKARSNEADQ